MSKRNREAGHRFERARAKKWREAGMSDAETSRAAAPGLDKQGVDIVGIGPFFEQDKYTVKAPNAYKVLSSMPDDGMHYRLLAHKRPHDKEATITLLESDWQELIALMVHNGIL